MNQSRLPSITFPPAPTRLEDVQGWAVQIQQVIQANFSRLNDLVGGNLRWQNLRSKLLLASVDAPAPASFTLTHDLGKIPEIFLWSLDQEGWIYATPSQRDAWTIQTITLTSSVAPASITLLVL